MKRDGGPAFPVPAGVLMDHTRGTSVPLSGMTVRDYFAAAALQALVSDRRHVVGMDQPRKESQYARGAYEIADAMLAERAK